LPLPHRHTFFDDRLAAPRVGVLEII
jgi:hypothetical protein